MQQVESFENTVTEVPLVDIIELTGQVNKQKREKAYKMQRIFFMTPQTLERDINAGIVDVSRICLLVIDEAHRATGNYAYCKIIESFEALSVGFRIVALSATPVSKLENLQQVVENLRVCKFEVRDEDDEEVKKYTHDKNIVEVLVDKENTTLVMEQHIFGLMEHGLKFLKQAKVVAYTAHPKFVNKMTLLNMQDEFRRKAAHGEFNNNEMLSAFF